MNPFIAIRRELHKIPEAGFQEFKTQQFLLDCINSLPNKYLEVETWNTGIFVFVRGSNPSETIAYRTDMDGLPIHESINSDYESQHKGFMHACGHDFHMSITIGLLSHFSKNQPKHNMLFIFQPAEEGPGGAAPMMETPSFKKWKPNRIYALHVAPELPVGTVATKAGILFSNSCEVDLLVRGVKSHAARPHLGVDAIVAASQLINQIQTIVSRQTNPLDNSVVSFGKITGGDVRNVLADEVRLEGTIRSTDIMSILDIQKKLRRVSKGIEDAFGCTIEVSFHGEYAEVNNDKIITSEFVTFCQKQASVNFLYSDVAMTAEDFGFFQRQVRGMMFWLGVNSESGLHTSTFSPDEKAIPFAVDLLIKFLDKIVNKLS